MENKQNKGVRSRLTKDRIVFYLKGPDKVIFEGKIQI